MPESVRQQRINEQNQKYQDERLNGMISNPNIVLSARSKQSKDIITIGLERFRDFITFCNYGESGYKILDHDRNCTWLTTTNCGEDSFKIMFKHHSIRLTAFGICTSSDPRFREFMPQIFDIYGYNTRNKRWDLLKHVNRSKPLDFMSRYVYDIESDLGNAFYRLIQFHTFCGRVALSYVDLYGDLIEEHDDPPDDVACSPNLCITYQNPPRIDATDNPNKHEPGILQKAMEIYGSSLNGFVKLKGREDSDTIYADAWGARGAAYYSAKMYQKIVVHFIFPHHSVMLNGYCIQADPYPNVDYWCLIGCDSYSDEGEIIDLEKRQKLSKEGSYYSYSVSSTKYYRVIRFVGLNDTFSFKSIDFYGIAKPAPEITEWTGTYYLPAKCRSNYVGMGS